MCSSYPEDPAVVWDDDGDDYIEYCNKEWLLAHDYKEVIYSGGLPDELFEL